MGLLQLDGRGRDPWEGDNSAGVKRRAVMTRTGEWERGSANVLRQERTWLVGRSRRKPEQLKGRGGGKDGALQAVVRTLVIVEGQPGALEGFSRRVTCLDLRFQKFPLGSSLAVQWLGPGAFTAEGPGRGTKIPQAVRRGQNNFLNKVPSGCCREQCGSRETSKEVVGEDGGGLERGGGSGSGRLRTRFGGSGEGHGGIKSDAWGGGWEGGPRGRGYVYTYG